MKGTRGFKMLGWTNVKEDFQMNHKENNMMVSPMSIKHSKDGVIF